MAGFTPSQLQVARALTRAPLYSTAGPKVRKAEAEAGIVESSLSNPAGGDRDSIGVLQQRPSQGWGSPQQLASIAYESQQFLKRAIPIAGKYGSAGQLAQAVQRSAFPERYDEHSAEAAQLLAELGGSPAAHQALSAVGASSAPAGATAAQQQDVASLLAQLAPAQQGSSLASTPLARPASAGGPEQAATGPRVPSQLSPAQPKGPDINSLLKAVQQISQDGSTEPAASSTSTAAPGAAQAPKVASSGKGLTAPVGVVKFDGKPVAAWIAPALAEAQRLGWKGTVESGYRSKAEQERIYNSGVRPAAVPGTSNHEIKAFPGGAVDVTEAAQLSKILQGTRYAKLLVWAGSKDPVHFSHPVNGRY